MKKHAYVDTSRWPVMKKQCSTCVFAMTSDGHWVNPSLAKMVEKRILDCSQICHHPRLFGRQETHLCRGTRDRQIELMHRLGVIPEPTDEAWEATRQRLNV